MNTGEGWDVGEEADENGCNKTIWRTTLEQSKDPSSPVPCCR